MRVLLTGSAGFIGTAIDRELRANGHEVVRVDALLPTAHRDSKPPYGTHILDVRDAHEWRSLLAGVDVVCHQAAVVGAGSTPADLPLYAAHNDLGTAALLAAMASVGTPHLVLASSMVVYGEGAYECATDGPVVPKPRRADDLANGDFAARCPACTEPLSPRLVDENAALAPRNAYAASKVAQEHYALSWARQTGASALALRYHNVYGPGMPRDTPYSGVAAMFRSSLERGEPPQVYEDGAQQRDFIHVADVARANLLAITAVTEVDNGTYRAYNVASGAPVTIADVANLVSRGSHRRLAPEITGAYRLGDVRHVVASPRRAADELGFRATVLPEDGLPEFASAPLRN